MKILVQCTGIYKKIKIKYTKSFIESIILLKIIWKGKKKYNM